MIGEIHRHAGRGVDHAVIRREVDPAPPRQATQQGADEGIDVGESGTPLVAVDPVAVPGVVDVVDVEMDETVGPGPMQRGAHRLDAIAPPVTEEVPSSVGDPAIRN